MLRGPNGAVRGYMKIGQDTTQRRRDQERQAVLLAELQHRVRNVLAMVRSIVSKGGGEALELGSDDLNTLEAYMSTLK